MSKKNIFIAFVLTLTTFTQAQTQFLPGFFINKQNEKTECLIKNTDSRFAPKNIEYKLSTEAVSMRISTDSLASFAVFDKWKYERFTTKIDVSKEKSTEISRYKEPEFEERNLLLKVLIEGDIYLYALEDGKQNLYFIKEKNNPIEQLVYKEYMDERRILRKNQLFKSQLSNYLKNSTVSNSVIANCNYNKKELMSLIEQHNQGSGNDTKIYEKFEKAVATLSIKAGTNLISAGVFEATAKEYLTDFGTKLNLRAGFEIEYLLPYNNYKWAFVSDPAFSIFEAHNEESVSFISDGPIKSKIKYNAFELPLGLRYYHKLNNDARLYATASYVINFSSNSTLEYRRSTDALLKEVTIRPRWNLYFALGYELTDKLGVEMRIYDNQLIVYRYSMWDIKYQVASLQLRYKILQSSPKR